MKFKIGDRIRCIKQSDRSFQLYVMEGTLYIMDGTVYDVINNGPNLIKVNDMDGNFAGYHYDFRFELDTTITLPDELFQL